jgi:peptide/nickel transport system ATP-binding protein
MAEKPSPHPHPDPLPREREQLLDVRGLKTHFRTDEGWVHAVDGVDLHIDAGETLGVVGESGCGKSVTAFSVMRLIPIPPAKIVAGEILWRGRDLVKVDEAEMRSLRAREIAMVFQEPMTSLNPVYSVGEQIAEVVRLHQALGRRAALDRAAEMLRLVRIPHPERRIHDYPHQFSGGMRQRVMIAMALSCNPKLLIADEPTTALDVTIQAQILDLLGELKDRLGMAVMLITHAMGVIAETAQRVVVMYAGKVVEEAPVGELFRDPRHPYTQGLIRSIPRIDTAATQKKRLETIAGVVPSLLDPKPGCRFAPRCPHAQPECVAETPPLRAVGAGHAAACIFAHVPTAERPPRTLGNVTLPAAEKVA